MVIIHHLILQDSRCLRICLSVLEMTIKCATSYFPSIFQNRNLEFQVVNGMTAMAMLPSLPLQTTYHKTKFKSLGKGQK